MEAGRGKTLKVISARTPNRPRLPTKNLGRSKPAAFLTTLPPARNSLPAPSTNRTPRIKSRNPPKRKRPGPLKPEATVPPRVAPASTSSGSKGRNCPRCASVAAISRTGVPASAVMVNSLGSYSVTPVRRAREIFTASTADRRGLVPAPAASTRGAERTASVKSPSEAGWSAGVIRAKAGRLFPGDEGRPAAGRGFPRRETSCRDWQCREDQTRRAPVAGNPFPRR